MKKFQVIFLLLPTMVFSKPLYGKKDAENFIKEQIVIECKKQFSDAFVEMSMTYGVVQAKILLDEETSTFFHKNPEEVTPKDVINYAKWSINQCVKNTLKQLKGGK